ncbi:MAG TPA: N-acetylneuraminate synthase family protein [Emcibacteraceae bacterium]|nr:N-acetylneuraminate synthase family protein [Emcibacteraceae bacterium]
MIKDIKIADRIIGAGKPVFIVAEVGINHNGDMALAKDAIEAAAQAGADSVKFQNYRTEDFVADKSLTFTYKSQGKEVTESQYDMFKRYEIGAEEIALLKEHCDKCGIIFHSTPTNEEGLNDLVKAGAPVLKNGSDYLSHVKLVKAMGKTGLPTVLSTGMATVTDIDESASVFRATGNDNLIILQCTSNYPTAPEDVHLAKMVTIGRTFGCQVGLSDHTQGSVAAIGATLLGACWIEKHFTLDKNLAGPDHWFSSNPAEMAQLVQDVRAAEKMMGNPALVSESAEDYSKNNYRLSCAAKTDLKKGHVIRAEDIDFQRPGNGLRPSQASLLVGRVLKTDVERAKVLTLDVFEKRIKL